MSSPILAPMQATKLFADLFSSERAGGMVLLVCTVVSLVLANSALQGPYTELWHLNLAGRALEYWINDGLMAVFFLLVGLELEREVYVGELSRGRQALFPALAAAGGMLIPAAIHMLLNHGTPTASGAGIPMATDIAFAIAVLAMLGDRVPLTLKVFLTAMAVMDDLGAIIVIAVFYTDTIHWSYLAGAIGLFAVLVLLNRLKLNKLAVYLVLGAFMWYLMARSGVHPTITGVLLAFTIPFGDGGERSPSYRLQHFLHRPVALAILPVFALANTAIVFAPGWASGLLTANSIGIFFGLVIGKPLGVLLFAGGAVAMGWCILPEGTRLRDIVGVSFLAGIGFTMSIFITLLAFNEPDIIAGTKTAVLISSLVAGTIGVIWLNRSLSR